MKDKLTDEQRQRRRESARRWKQGNKHRRTSAGYADADEKLATAREANRRSYAKKTGKQVNPVLTKRDLWWEELKKKHAGKPRLKKSLKPPIPLRTGWIDQEIV